MDRCFVELRQTSTNPLTRFTSQREEAETSNVSREGVEVQMSGCSTSALNLLNYLLAQVPDYYDK